MIPMTNYVFETFKILPFISYFLYYRKILIQCFKKTLSIYNTIKLCSLLT